MNSPPRIVPLLLAASLILAAPHFATGHPREGRDAAGAGQGVKAVDSKAASRPR
jgi:hypothetical protein